MSAIEDLRNALSDVRAANNIPVRLEMSQATFDYLDREYPATDPAETRNCFGFPIVIDQSIPDGQFRWGYRS